MKYLLIAVLGLGVISCDTANKPIGGAKDSHGCSVSAGQTWSSLRNDCIRVFEDGIRLNPVKNSGSAVISAFVVYNQDRSKAELFLPSTKRTEILSKNSDGSFSNSAYRYDEGNGTLYKGGVALYRK